jgi:hypothetical protein
MHINKLYEKEPDDMIVGNKKNYAYVVLLTKVEYFPGALVLSESLCKLGTEAELVIMISSNIPDSIRIILQRFYSKIIQIKRVIGVDEKYNKLQALNLIEYKKIIIIDIDSIILKYPDYLFTLETPAITLMPSITPITTVVVVKEDLLKKDLLIYSGLIVLTPNTKMYTKIINSIDNKESYKEGIERFFTKELPYKTVINNDFLGIKYNDDKHNLWTKSSIIQFIGDKPFLYKSKYRVEERAERDDNKLWFFYYSTIINKNYDFLKFTELDDVNNLSKYYLAELSRNIYAITKILQSNIDTQLEGNYPTRLNKIFRTKEIKRNFVYYHIDSLKEYNSAYKPITIIQTTKQDICVSISNTQNIKIFMLINKDEKINDDEIKNKDLKIINVYKYKLKGDIIKNILVALESQLSYSERIKFINSIYNTNSYYYISIVICNFNDNYNFKNMDTIKFYEDMNSKIKLTSLFLNENTFKLITSKKLDFIKRYQNILENLKFQSLKKWIYNNYSYQELQLLIIINDCTHDHHQDINNHNKIKIIDNNNYSSDIIIKHKIDLKLFFFDIIFTKSIQYKHIININYNKDYVYCIDGIYMVDINNKSSIVNER